MRLAMCGEMRGIEGPLLLQDEGAQLGGMEREDGGDAIGSARVNSRLWAEPRMRGKHQKKQSRALDR